MVPHHLLSKHAFITLCLLFIKFMKLVVSTIIDDICTPECSARRHAGARNHVIMRGIFRENCFCSSTTSVESCSPVWRLAFHSDVTILIARDEVSGTLKLKYSFTNHLDFNTNVSYSIDSVQECKVFSHVVIFAKEQKSYFLSLFKLGLI